jgi:hypothetical protein
VAVSANGDTQGSESIDDNGKAGVLGGKRGREEDTWSNLLERVQHVLVLKTL